MAGRCLAWGFGVEEQVDEERFQDAFMYGIKDLVSIVQSWIRRPGVACGGILKLRLRCSFGYQGTSS